MKLSIIVPNYNYGHFLEEAITSIYQNRSQDFEVLLVDDGSTDHSREVIAALAGRFPSLRVFYHEKNQGIEAAVATACGQMRGEYFHPFASDDLFLPYKIDLALDYFYQFPEVSFFCSDNCYFYNANRELHIDKLYASEEFVFLSPEQVYQLFKETHFWIPGSTIFAKTATYLKYLPYEKNLRFASDFWINHRLSLKEGIGYIPHAIRAQRMHPAMYSASPSLESRRHVWLHILQLLEEQQDEYKPLYKSGVLRRFGLRAIYKDLLFTPKYWKYLFPLLKKL